MRYLIGILLVLAALVIAFLFAGVLAALIFGVLIALSGQVFKAKKISRPQIFLSSSLLFAVVGYLLMLFFGLLGAHEHVHKKVNGIKNELVKAGYDPKWIIISQKRNSLYNYLLSNSVDNSKHLYGKAIDLYIIDINDDGIYNRTDYKLVEQASKNFQKIHPETTGKVFSYIGEGYFSQRMIHVELHK